MVRVDTFGVFLGVVVLAATAMALLLAIGYLRREQLEVAEYVALMLFSALGMIVMTTANDLIVVFLALEILSIPLYVLAAYDRRRLTLAGSGHQVLRARRVLVGDLPLRHRARLRRDRHHVAHRHRHASSVRNTLFDPGTLEAGLVLLLVGLGFKVAAVPFHMWTPDVYQGAPTPVTAFMASATKVAALRGAAAHLRRRVPHLPRPTGSPAVWALDRAHPRGRQRRRPAADRPEAPARLLVDRPRRLPAHGARDRHRQGARSRALLPVRLHVHGHRFVRGRHRAEHAEATTTTRIDGTTAASRPADRCSAALLVLFMLAQAGIPLTSGFVAKLDVFSATASAGEYVLVVIGAVATVSRRSPTCGSRSAVAATPGAGEVTERASGRPGRRRHLDRAGGLRRRDDGPRHRAGGVRPLGPATRPCSRTSSPGCTEVRRPPRTGQRFTAPSMSAVRTPVRSESGSAGVAAPPDGRRSWRRRRRAASASSRVRCASS